HRVLHGYSRRQRQMCIRDRNRTPPIPNPMPRNLTLPINKPTTATKARILTVNAISLIVHFS
ncbi:hypothetical protein KQJ25_36520, partial [Escherichia sp. S69_ASV_4]|nr:hypothetical protein [Escherichia sp. S69_ASV_4]